MFRVLVVDDEIAAREAVCAAVHWEEFGFELCGNSADGELALASLRELKPELLITDIHMPYMDGMQLCRTAAREFPRMRILVVSASNDAELLREAMALGVRACLPKPLDARLLASVLRRLGDELREEATRREREAALHACLDNAGLIIRERLLGELLGGADAEVIRQRAHVLGVNLTAACYQLLLLRPLGTGPSPRALPALSVALEQFARTGSDTVLLYRQGEVFTLLLLGDSPEHCLGRAQKLSQAACAAARRAGLQLAISMGAAVNELLDVPAAFADATRELNRYMGENLSPGISAQHTGADGGRVPLEALCLPPLIEELRTASPTGVRKILERRARALGADNSVIMAHYLYADALLTAARISNDAGIRGRENGQGLTPLYPPCQGGLDSGYCEGGQVTGNPNLNLPSQGGQVTGDLNLPSQGGQVTGDPCRKPPLAGGAGGVDPLARGCTHQTYEAATEPGLTPTQAELAELMQHSELALVRALESRGGRNSGRNAAVIRRARAYIDERYADPQLTLREVANHVALSGNHFCTVFSRTMGVTYNEYLTDLRIRHAQELLRTTDMRSSEIAYAVGYNDPHYFSNIFKKVTGISPRDYRKEYRVKDNGI